MLSASLLGGPDDSRKGGPTIKKIAHLLLLLICSRMIDTGGNVSRNGVSLLENPTTKKWTGLVFFRNTYC